MEYCKKRNVYWMVLLIGLFLAGLSGCTVTEEKGKTVISLFPTPTPKPTEVPTPTPELTAAPTPTPKPPVEISFPKTFVLENKWKIVVNSADFLPETKNLQFNLLVENLGDTVARCIILEKTYILDDLGKEYMVSGNTLSSLKKLTPAFPIKVRLTFPELKGDVSAISLYLYFEGEGLKKGDIYEFYSDYPLVWFHSGYTLPLGPIRLEKISGYKKVEEKETTLPKTFATGDGSWSVTVESCQLVKEDKVQFILMVKNLQEDTAEYRIDKNATYLLDNLGNEYRNPEVSDGQGKVSPDSLVKGYMTFSQLNKEAEGVVLFLGFVRSDGKLETWTLGPIKFEK